MVSLQNMHFENAWVRIYGWSLLAESPMGRRKRKNSSGVEFNPNMPTEEIFTMPKKTGVNGKVYATKPLDYNGTLIDDFWFSFKMERL